MIEARVITATRIILIVIQWAFGALLVFMVGTQLTESRTGPGWGVPFMLAAIVGVAAYWSYRLRMREKKASE